MLIQLNKDRRITSDEHQYILCKRKKVKDKKRGEEWIGVYKDYWEPYLYFPTIKLLLHTVPNQMLRESNANGWAECKKVLEDTYKLIDRRISA